MCDRTGRRGSLGDRLGKRVRAATDSNWYDLAAFVAHHAPACGDPLEMPIDRLILWSAAICRRLERESKAIERRHRMTG